MRTEHSAIRRSRWPALAVGSLVAVTVLSAATVRWSGATIAAPDAAVVAARDLRFEDRPDGSIAVIDAKSGTEIDAVVGEAGFVRGALRGLARERRRHSIGSEPPFHLLARQDGRLTLVDASTGSRIDLESFGPINAAEFARWLPAAAPLPPAPRAAR